MIEYETKPDKRCVHCKGREVITIKDGKPVETSLEYAPDVNDNVILQCKDKNECRQNIRAENTEIDFYYDDKGTLMRKEVKYMGAAVMDMEVER